jgi:5-methylcytosine-specific restriction endonuclease McrA
VAQVVDRALDALILQLEKRKFGATTAPRRLRRPKSSITRRPRRQRAIVRKRYVPAHVRRAVWERDHGQCTFVSANGTRCKARRFLEFDHVDPVARGGQTTVDTMRLRCRAHNQYEAERAFGAGFMNRKRHEARCAAAEARGRGAAKEQVAGEQVQDVLDGLRNLGCRADEARRAAAVTATLNDATLEERMRAALKSLSRRS